MMLELKNNKHNTYYRCTYLYIVNAVIFKLLLTSFLKRDLAKKRQYWGNTEMRASKVFANHNALGQLTNHNTFCFSEGGPSSNPELIVRLCQNREKGIVIMSIMWKMMRFSNHRAWEHVLVHPQNKIKTL